MESLERHLIAGHHVQWSSVKNRVQRAPLSDDNVRRNLLLTKADIHRALERYFVNGDRSPDIVRASAPTPDAEIGYAAVMIENMQLHEPDFAIFSHFQDPSETILDIGANYGYSAISIWASSAKANVISFEPNEAYADILRELKRLRVHKTGRKSYDYRMVGVGEHNGRLDIAMPVVNGKMVAALATAHDKPHLPSMAQNVMFSAEHYSNEKRAETFSIFQFSCPVRTIDDLLATERFEVPTTKITAIKMDTEGFEDRVLKGAIRTIEAHKPLIFSEINSRVEPILRNLGYIPAEIQGSHVRPCDICPKTVNIVFVHSSKIDRYRSIGLISTHS